MALDERAFIKSIIDDNGVDGVFLILDEILNRAMLERNAIQMNDEDNDKWQKIYELAHTMINEMFP